MSEKVGKNFMTDALNQLESNEKLKHGSATKILNSIRNSMQEGYKISFYIGQFDFENNPIEDWEDMPPDFFDEDKNIETNFLWVTENIHGDKTLGFRCMLSGKDHRIDLREWTDRIAYTKPINPEGKVPSETEVFEALVEIGRKHDIPLEFKGDNKKSV